jgi:hypothetical protein
MLRNTEDGSSMGARTKLNAAYLNGTLLIAGVVGALTGSWTVLGVALAGLLVWHVVAGTLRGPRAPR